MAKNRGSKKKNKQKKNGHMAAPVPAASVNQKCEDNFDAGKPDLDAAEQDNQEMDSSGAEEAPAEVQELKAEPAADAVPEAAAEVSESKAEAAVTDEAEADKSAAAEEVPAPKAENAVAAEAMPEAAAKAKAEPAPVAEVQPPKVKARPKPPSWMKPTAEEKTAPATQTPKPEAAAVPPEKASAAPSAEPKCTAASAVPSESADPSAQLVADSVLLGAPVFSGGDSAADAAVDALLAPTVVPEADKKSQIHPLAGVVGGFTAPLNLEGLSHKEEAPSAGTKAVRPKEVADGSKVPSEIAHLGEIVDSIESLDYLKPRLKKISLTGCEASDLVGLYRIVSQVLLDNMRTQLNTMRQMRERYEKRLRQVVVDESAKFVKMVNSGQEILSSARPAEEADEPGSMALRKQLEIKDALLLKAREAQEEAEARCEKVAKDVINIRQRQEKDVALHLQKAREALLGKLLPILDSFESALANKSSFVNVESVVEGLENIHKQLLDACVSEGLQPIEAKGQPFDPNLHEAMGYVTTSELPEDCVVTELRRGYMLNDKLLRATMVQVAKPE
ncbi:nucleotide exchange factor GrpE [bacterium]|nr:nucleotide exchange factor GrpE [bacterium]